MGTPLYRGTFAFGLCLAMPFFASAQDKILALQAIDDQPLTPPLHYARHMRALELLETIGSADAKELLGALAKGPADAWLTREARLSLTRLAKRARAGDPP